MRDDEPLVALVGSRVVGRVTRRSAKGLQFTYDESWSHDAQSYPLSWSMPLVQETHENEVVESFLWGLLPDNDAVLRRWGHQFGVSARRVFDLLHFVGEDCSGAVQFVAADRLDVWLDQRPGRVEWVDEEGVAERLRELGLDEAAWRLSRDTGQFSLAGAQRKTALIRWQGRWGVPSGRFPTTHILKPPIRGFDGHVENEHLCLELARALGMSAATSWVACFGDQQAIVVERYDRLRGAESVATIQRVHQEDMCQAMGVHPSMKYQAERGPGAQDIVHLLRAASTAPAEDVRRFIDSLVFNALIAGTDAHAKNVSILHAPGEQLRMAPLYDLASILPYDGVDRHRMRLAMKVGQEYALRKIMGRHWRRLADEVGLEPDAVVQRVAGMADAMPQAVGTVVQQAREDGLDHPILEAFERELPAHAAEVRARLDDA